MARKARMELIYYPVDVARVLDSKLRALTRIRGWVAYYVYDVLLSMIYGDKGYYLVWKHSVEMEVVDRARSSEEEIEDILQEMFRQELFDVRLFSEYGVLTSAGVQRRYLQAVKDRVRKLRMRGRDFPIREEFLVLDEKELKELKLDTEFVRDESGQIPGEDEFMHDECDKEKKRREEERKEEKRRAEQTTVAPCGAPEAPAAPHTLRIGAVALNEMEYAALSSRYGREQVEAKAAHLDAWMKDNGRAVTSCFATLRAWLSDDAAKERQRKNAAAQPAAGKRTGAHNFTQRAYTDEELDALFPTDSDRLREGP